MNLLIVSRRISFTCKSLSIVARGIAINFITNYYLHLLKLIVLKMLPEALTSKLPTDFCHWSSGKSQKFDWKSWARKLWESLRLQWEAQWNKRRSNRTNEFGWSEEKWEAEVVDSRTAQNPSQPETL